MAYILITFSVTYSDVTEVYSDGDGAAAEEAGHVDRRGAAGRDMGQGLVEREQNGLIVKNDTSSPSKKSQQR